MRKKIQECTDRLAEIDANLWNILAKGKNTYQWFEGKKKGYTSDLNDLLKELREKYPRYALLYYPKPLPPESLPLKENELLLEYSLGDEASYLFVVKKGGIKKIVRIPMGREILEEKVRSFMEPMETRQFEGFSVKRAKELYDILLAGALEDAKENEKVIIISEGILGLLPFNALVVREGARVEDSVYVGDRYSLSYYQSAAVLAFNRSIQAAKAERVLFALGNPIFNKEDPRYVAWKNGSKEQVLVASLDQYSFRALATARGVEGKGKGNPKKELEYRPLPETEREVVEISRIMGVEAAPPDVLLSVMANESELKKVKLDSYRYIHFATHADLPGEVQGIYEPFILLGQVENAEGDDGFLTLSEVLDLKLNADMVVLSACLTGRGKVMEGEGVINFARAFQHAGAQSVVVSLWEVSSNEAVDYMKTFYGHLKAGKGRAEALGLARKEMKAKYPNPFFWAVFILHGEG
jgi:CHAT domain-containing protein